MANCVCYQCKRPMDCTGEDLCDLCEYDREQLTASTELAGAKPADFEWLSDCCASTYILELDESEYGTTGFCLHCGDSTAFRRVRTS